jgi:hypothetical protein
MLTLSDARITDEYIEFFAYPFAPATVAEIGLLPWSLVAEVLPDAAPPEVRTLFEDAFGIRAGDVLFVPATQREALRAAAGEAGVPCVRRVDVWGLILEPFLDTTFDHEHQERTLATLAANGVSREECLALRQEVALAMVGYNFGAGLWDWAHLGLYDLLSAYQLAAEADFAARYWAAVRVALRGRLYSA